MSNDESITYHPIGHVENAFDEPAPAEQIRAVESRIIINPDLVEGLQGLNLGQQVMVIFHFHLSQDFGLLQHPRADSARPLRGIFALRSPHRPNPIGVTIVDLLVIEGNVIHVCGLDAINGTPVLDLKPA